MHLVCMYVGICGISTQDHRLHEGMFSHTENSVPARAECGYTDTECGYSDTECGYTECGYTDTCAHMSATNQDPRLHARGGVVQQREHTI